MPYVCSSELENIKKEYAMMLTERIFQSLQSLNCGECRESELTEKQGSEMPMTFIVYFVVLDNHPS